MEKRNRPIEKGKELGRRENLETIYDSPEKSLE
jgi:hypothetical protein